MKTVCKQDKCAGCMACLEICPKNAIHIEDNLNAYNAVIGEQCIDCGVCHKICQKNNPATAVLPQCWYQGWAEDVDVRKGGSSGGLAIAIAKAFVNKGGKVCSCTFAEGKFGFQIVDNVAELHHFAGSKYVKSTPERIYKSICRMLQKGEKILFIALPCQVSALRNFVGKNLEENLYTIDLICHGTPSAKVLDIFLSQYGKEMSALKNIRFRDKDIFQICCDGENIVPQGLNDRYMISFLSSLIYTDNCYECDYAKQERVSDLTIGDSWGSTLPESEWKKGISLVLCQTEKGNELLEQANLILKPVDLEKAVSNNHQLKHPSVRPKEWNRFFEDLGKGKKFNSLVLRALPRKCMKQQLKSLLIKSRI